MGDHVWLADYSYLSGEICLGLSYTAHEHKMFHSLFS